MKGVRAEGRATKAVKGHMDDSERLANSAEGLGCDSGRLANSAEGFGCDSGRLANGASGAGRPVDDSERLAAYDAFARGIRAELAEVGTRMDVLRAENKVKTATYRQLFATRMTLKDIDRRLVERGL